MTDHVLLTPGPVNTSPRVKGALQHADLNHRDAEFSALFARLTGKLRRIFRGGPAHEVLLVTGSGTAAMECAIGSTAHGKILVVDNGAFGERIAEIATLHGLSVVHLRYPPGECVRVDDVRRVLRADAGIRVVAMVHHETSVGLLNPVREVGALCAERDGLFLVDAVSSLGAEDLDVVRDGIDVCWSSANKCLHGIPGVSFLCVSPRVWPRIESIAPRVFSLDLKRHRKYAAELSQTPFTPAVAAFFALEAACDEFLEDGARVAMYAERNRVLRDGLRRLGFLTSTGRESHSIVTARLPAGVDFATLDRGLKERGFGIYDCKPPMKGRYFQVANMGALPEGALERFLAALAGVIGEGVANAA